MESEIYPRLRFFWVWVHLFNNSRTEEQLHRGSSARRSIKRALIAPLALNLELPGLNDMNKDDKIRIRDPFFHFFRRNIPKVALIFKELDRLGERVNLERRLQERLSRVHDSIANKRNPGVSEIFLVFFD